MTRSRMFHYMFARWNNTGEVNKTSAIHPIVVQLLPVETEKPHSLTEVQFFLLETKVWL